MKVTVCKSSEGGHGHLPMTWDTKDAMERRHEFMTLAGAGAVSVSELCRRFGISRKTGYKWIKRFANDAQSGLSDRRPQCLRWSNQTSLKVEQALLALRTEHPTLGTAQVCTAGCKTSEARSRR